MKLTTRRQRRLCKELYRRLDQAQKTKNAREFQIVSWELMNFWGYGCMETPRKPRPVGDWAIKKAKATDAELRRLVPFIGMMEALFTESMDFDSFERHKLIQLAEKASRIPVRRKYGNKAIRSSDSQ